MLTKTLSRSEMNYTQELALRSLCVPLLAQIVTFEMTGHLPALRGLSNPVSAIFTETILLLDKNPLAAQLSQYMIEMEFVARTREEYDHHVTVTPFGKLFLEKMLSNMEFSLDDELILLNSLEPL